MMCTLTELPHDKASYYCEQNVDQIVSSTVVMLFTVRLASFNLLFLLCSHCAVVLRLILFLL